MGTGGGRGGPLTVLLLTSRVGNFLLMNLTQGSMALSLRKDGRVLGSEQVCGTPPR